MDWFGVIVVVEMWYCFLCCGGVFVSIFYLDLEKFGIYMNLLKVVFFYNWVLCLMEVVDFIGGKYYYDIQSFLVLFWSVKNVCFGNYCFVCKNYIFESCLFIEQWFWCCFGRF